MRRGTILSLVVAGAVSLGAAEVAAQPILSVSAGGSVPVGDYADYASTGWLVTGGILFPVGQRPLMLGGHGLFGSNSHSDFAGDKTTLTGALGTVLYRLGDPARPGAYVFGNIGMLRHAFSSEDFPEDDAAESGLAYGAGLGASVPRGRFNFHGHVGFLTASIDGSTTSFVPVVIGMSFLLGDRR